MTLLIWGDGIKQVFLLLPSPARGLFVSILKTAQYCKCFLPINFWANIIFFTFLVFTILAYTIFLFVADTINWSEFAVSKIQCKEWYLRPGFRIDPNKINLTKRHSTDIKTLPPSTRQMFFTVAPHFQYQNEKENLSANEELFWEWINEILLKIVLVGWKSFFSLALKIGRNS